MARPNNPAAIQTRIKGLKEAKAAFQALPQIVRDRMNVATETTVREIARQAKAHILASPSVRTRALYNAIGWSMNTKNGRGKVGVQRVTTTLTIGGRAIKVKGIIVAGNGGSALTSRGAKKIVPSRYAHFVEFGTVKMPAEPFMIPSAEAEKQPYLSRCRAAGRSIEEDTARIGMAGGGGLL